MIFKISYVSIGLQIGNSITNVSGLTWSPAGDRFFLERFDLKKTGQAKKYLELYLN